MNRHTEFSALYLGIPTKMPEVVGLEQEAPKGPHIENGYKARSPKGQMGNI